MIIPIQFSLHFESPIMSTELNNPYWFLVVSNLISNWNLQKYFYKLIHSIKQVCRIQGYVICMYVWVINWRLSILLEYCLSVLSGIGHCIGKVHFFQWSFLFVAEVSFQPWVSHFVPHRLGLCEDRVVLRMLTRWRRDHHGVKGQVDRANHLALRLVATQF